MRIELEIKDGETGADPLIQILSDSSYLVAVKEHKIFSNAEHNTTIIVLDTEKVTQ